MLSMDKSRLFQLALEASESVDLMLGKLKLRCGPFYTCL